MEPTVTVPISVVLRSLSTNFVNKVYLVITKRNNDNAKLQERRSVEKFDPYTVFKQKYTSQVFVNIFNKGCRGIF